MTSPTFIEHWQIYKIRFRYNHTLAVNESEMPNCNLMGNLVLVTTFLQKDRDGIRPYIPEANVAYVDQVPSIEDEDNMESKKSDTAEFVSSTEKIPANGP